MTDYAAIVADLRKGFWYQARINQLCDLLEAWAPIVAAVLYPGEDEGFIAWHARLNDAADALTSEQRAAAHELSKSDG